MLQQILADPAAQTVLLGLLTASGALLLTLIMSLLFRLAAAAGVRLSREQWDLVRACVQAGIRAAEEWAAACVKSGGEPPTSAEKTAHAVQAAKSLAPPKLKLGSWPEERLVAAVQAELPAERQRLSVPPLRATLPPQR